MHMGGGGGVHYGEKPYARGCWCAGQSGAGDGLVGYRALAQVAVFSVRKNFMWQDSLPNFEEEDSRRQEKPFAVAGVPRQWS